jgi:hypothetical protein
MGFFFAALPGSESRPASQIRDCLRQFRYILSVYIEAILFPCGVQNSVESRPNGLRVK